MIRSLFAALFVALTLGAPSPGQDAPRKRHPLAPSLPLLTPEEEDRLDKIIDRFILFDTGRLPGAAGQQALRDFEKLSYDAIPALIRGLNRAAAIEHSCPALVISKKLHRFLTVSEDPKLLEFARDEIGAGVGRTVHARLIDELRFATLMRKNALARREPKPPGLMTVAELAEAGEEERGPRQAAAWAELGRRRGSDAVAALAVAAANADTEQKTAFRALLEQNLAGQTPVVLKAALKDGDATVRQAAARAVGARQPALVGELLPLLADDLPEVRQAARQALAALLGEDFGPAPNADKAEVAESQTKWKAWLDLRGPGR